jgi:hypothetical protein
LGKNFSVWSKTFYSGEVHWFKLKESAVGKKFFFKQVCDLPAYLVQYSVKTVVLSFPKLYNGGMPMFQRHILPPSSGLKFSNRLGYKGQLERSESRGTWRDINNGTRSGIIDKQGRLLSQVANGMLGNNGPFQG